MMFVKYAITSNGQVSLKSYSHLKIAILTLCEAVVDIATNALIGSMRLPNTAKIDYRKIITSFVLID